MVSVLLTNFNYSDYLPLAIQSVLNQSLKDWELVIVDDGSQDDSISIIKNHIKD